MVCQEIGQLVLHCVMLLVRLLLLEGYRVADLWGGRGTRLPRGRGVCTTSSSLMRQQLGKQAVAACSSSSSRA
jgi:hypothetical protein